MKKNIKQTDERNIVFSRLKYEKGSSAYESYYSMRPDLKVIDDEFKTKPTMGGQDSTFYNENYSNIQQANFDFLDDIRHLCTGPVAPNKVYQTPQEFSTIVKGLMKAYGAAAVGTTFVDEDLYYSHHGRPLELFGSVVDSSLKYAIVFGYEMKKDLVFTAPRLPETVAVTNGYVDAAVGGMQLAYYIRRLGYSARNNMDGNYLLPMVPLAVKAGLGELGKNGLILNAEYGNRLRLGAVLTDMPLISDDIPKPNLSLFCEHCERCVKSCPGKAIQPEKGGYFYDNNCYKMWQILGSDCGVCIAACPFSSNVKAELLQNLDNPENMNTLVEYCDRNHKGRAFVKDDPEWFIV